MSSESPPRRIFAAFKHRWTALVLIGLGFVITTGLILIWRTGKAPTKPDWVSRASWVIANEAINALEAAPSARVADREAVVALLEASNTEHAPHVDTTPEQRRALYEMAATWLDLLRQADVEAYIAWRQSMGYRLFQDFDEALRVGHYQRRTLAMGYRFFAGRDMPGDIAYDTLFRTLFEGALRKNGRELRPQRISVGSDMGGVQFALAGPADRAINSTIFYDTFARDRRWTSNNASPGRDHWAPPITWKEIAQRDGEVLAAYLRIGASNTKGQWFPMEVFCYYDPQRAIWLLHQAVMTNSYVIETSYEY